MVRQARVCKINERWQQYNRDKSKTLSTIEGKVYTLHISCGIQILPETSSQIQCLLWLGFRVSEMYRGRPAFNISGFWTEIKTSQLYWSHIFRLNSPPSTEGRWSMIFRKKSKSHEKAFCWTFTLKSKWHLTKQHPSLGNSFQLSLQNMQI